MKKRHSVVGVLTIIQSSDEVSKHPEEIAEAYRGDEER